MPTAAFLSPHLDDAAFSCGGLMARLANADWQVVHVTLFAATVPDPSGFALECQLDKGLELDVDYMSLRRDEDREFTGRIGASEVVHGPFPEAPHRGYSSPEALFGSILEEDSVFEPLCSYLRALLREHAPELLVAPQAVGEHVDHVQLAKAVADVSSLETCPPLVWYRDAPYVIEHPDAHSPFPHIGNLDPLAINIEPVLQQKLSAAAAYESQLELQFARRFSDREWASTDSHGAGNRDSENCETRGTGEIAMRRALSHLAREEGRRVQPGSEGRNLHDHVPGREGGPLPAERFRADTGVTRLLDV